MASAPPAYGKPEKKERPARRVAHRLPDANGTGAVIGQDGPGERERAAERADHPNPCRIMSARHRALPPPALAGRTDHENDGHCVAIGVRKRQRRAEPALVLCPLGERSAQTKQRQRTVPCHLDLAQGKRHVGFCECLDHCFLGREPGRQSVHPVAALAVVDFARRKDLAQVPVPERRQRVLDILNGHDIASDADAVPVNLARQGDHAHAVIVAVPRESTDATFERPAGRLLPHVRITQTT